MGRKSFTPTCYAFIGILVENPEAVFRLTEQRIAERMERHGWLTRRTIELPQTAGTYRYMAKFTNFVPTDEGLRLYHALHDLVKHADKLVEIQKALQGELRKKRFQRNLVE